MAILARMLCNIRTVQYLRKSAASLSLAVIICSAVHPSAIFTHYGFSYYGNMPATLVPFSLGLVASAYYLFRAVLAAGSGPLNAFSRMRTGLAAVALAMLGLVVTPSLSTVPVIQAGHVVFGTVAFFVSTLLSMRYMVWIRNRFTDWLL